MKDVRQRFKDGGKDCGKDKKEFPSAERWSPGFSLSLFPRNRKTRRFFARGTG
jgi:hypothetical protein